MSDRQEHFKMFLNLNASLCGATPSGPSCSSHFLAASGLWSIGRSSEQITMKRGQGLAWFLHASDVPR